MTKREQIIEMCLSFAGVYQDHPFRSASEHTVVRHGYNKKIFALIFNKDGKVWVNLKTDPMLGDFLRQMHEAIVPAYHMNKEHWISVILDDTIHDNEIFDLVSNSYELTKPKQKRKKINQEEQHNE